MPDQQIIDVNEAKRILALEEGHFLDFKGVAISPAKISETISAFGNAAGGELFIGIGERDNKKTHFWSGFDRMEAANALFQVISRMSAMPNQYAATFLSCPGLAGHVLHLIIPKTRGILKGSDNQTVFVRNNAQNDRIYTPERLLRLELDKGVISFEDELVNTPIETITNSTTALSFILDVVPSAEPEEWMSKQNLSTGGRPIVAGVLLFSDEPQAALPKRSSIKLYRYGTRADDGSRDQLIFGPVTIEGSIYDQITSAVSRTKELVEGIQILGERGFVPVSYPHDTLHEIITNAVLHRDYSVLEDVQVRIFDNRIEVESPGRLPGHITINNILQEQSARNPRIIRLINKFPNPPNKDIGEGLNTAFDAMRKLRLQPPEIVENQFSVTVHIRHAVLASPQEAVMNYLKDHDSITNRIARELTGITSENVMKDVFLSLKRRDMLEPVPGKRGNASAWRKYTGYYNPIPDSREVSGPQLELLGIPPVVKPKR
jgi:ATP-dependent DNA helicase RecG